MHLCAEKDPDKPQRPLETGIKRGTQNPKVGGLVSRKGGKKDHSG